MPCSLDSRHLTISDARGNEASGFDKREFRYNIMFQGNKENK
jgi:hypothetical protein